MGKPNVNEGLQKKIADAGLGPDPEQLNKAPSAIAEEALTRHLAGRPVAVMMVSIGANGQAIADCTPFPDLSTHAFCQKLLNTFIDEGFKNALMNARRQGLPQ